MIRMSEDLRERLKIQAKANHMSYNAYVVSILEKAVEPEWPHISPEELEAIGKEHCAWLDELRALYPKDEGVQLPEDFDWKAAKGAYLLAKCENNEKKS